MYGHFFAFFTSTFFEQTLLLSGINWVWHAFIDPDDVENEYVQSVTILGGTINVLNEDSHVVHHQYPGSHWTRHPSLLTKHEAAYANAKASVFYGTHTFELLALILMADYDKLADRFVGRMPPNAAGELFGCGTHDASKVPRPSAPGHEAVELIKARLRACCGGARARDLLRADAGRPSRARRVGGRPRPGRAGGGAGAGSRAAERREGGAAARAVSAGALRRSASEAAAAAARPRARAGSCAARTAGAPRAPATVGRRAARGVACGACVCVCSRRPGVPATSRGQSLAPPPE